jgi:hypothetical protein
VKRKQGGRGGELKNCSFDNEDDCTTKGVNRCQWYGDDKATKERYQQDEQTQGLKKFPTCAHKQLDKITVDSEVEQTRQVKSGKGHAYYTFKQLVEKHVVRNLWEIYNISQKLEVEPHSIFYRNIVSKDYCHDTENDNAIELVGTLKQGTRTNPILTHEKALHLEQLVKDGMSKTDLKKNINKYGIWIQISYSSTPFSPYISDSGGAHAQTLIMRKAKIKTYNVINFKPMTTHKERKLQNVIFSLGVTVDKESREAIIATPDAHDSPTFLSFSKSSQKIVGWGFYHQGIADNLIQMEGRVHKSSPMTYQKVPNKSQPNAHVRDLHNGCNYHIYKDDTKKENVRYWNLTELHERPDAPKKTWSKSKLVPGLTPFVDTWDGYENCATFACKLVNDTPNRIIPSSPNDVRNVGMDPVKLFNYLFPDKKRKRNSGDEPDDLVNKKYTRINNSGLIPKNSLMDVPQYITMYEGKSKEDGEKRSDDGNSSEQQQQDTQVITGRSQRIRKQPPDEPVVIRRSKRVKH